jgi:hypothetical protein
MDSDKEMIQKIMDDDATYDDNVREQLVIITCLNKMFDGAEEKKKRSHHGGSRPGRSKSKLRQRLEGHMMLYYD